MGDLSPWHLAIIAGVFVLLFGSKKLPDAARSLGRSMRIFKSEIKAAQDDDAPKTIEAGATEPAPAAPVDQQTDTTPGTAPGPR